MDLNNIILIFLLIGFNLFFYKYFLFEHNKYKLNFLIDNDFKKPQAFHVSPIPMVGGFILFFSFLIIFCYFAFYKNSTFIEYLSICTLLFFLGIIDDLKVNIKPLIRLILMFGFLLVLISYNNFYIEKTGIETLNKWLENSKIFSLIFVCLCFLFVINGANLIDGYNGLLGFHSLIILINLFLINFLTENYDLASLLFFVILVLIVFIIFNFPRAKIFLGDSGSYFLGAFIAISVIKTSIANPTISPFYFCILLFYLFFEVFFSFFRKIIFEKILPVYPDGKHLHMLFYNNFSYKRKKYLEK